MGVRVERLTKAYSTFRKKKVVKAVTDVTFRIEPGEVYALLGPNGAGKSTLIKMIAGLVTPTSGTIEFGAGGSKNYKFLSAVLEGTRNVYWRLTPLENLHYFANLRGVPSRQIKERAERYLTELDIDAKRKNQSRHLSRGMLQKLAIATALITDPKILLLDEPTLGVDVASARKIKEKIRELAHREGKTILLTTHQMELVDKLADRVGIINQGRLVNEGTLSELKKNTRRFLYHLSLRGSYLFSDEFMARHRVKKLNSPDAGERSEFEIDCGDKEGFYELLHILSLERIEVISLQQKQDDLEEVFLRSIGEAGFDENGGAGDF